MAEIDDDVYEALKLPDAEKERTVKTELGLSLYDRGALSFGKARTLAGLSAREFHRLLGEHRIERHYTREDHVDCIEYNCEYVPC